MVLPKITSAATGADKSRHVASRHAVEMIFLYVM
jgi:hypothetical protein